MATDEERESNFYDSKYLTEYYDLWAEENRESLDTQGDAVIYGRALKNHVTERNIKSSSSNESFVVLDVGTGTGRILVNLVNSAVSSGIDLSSLEFIGLDNEPAMLLRAREIQQSTPNMDKLRSVSWIAGEAASLTASKELAQRLKTVDIVLFGVGSVSHLIGRDEPQHFFNEVAKLLRPGTGTLYLPIQDDLICERSITERPEITQTWAELEVAQDFSSKLYPGLIYKQFPIESSETDDFIKTDNYRFEVVKKVATGAEELVEKNRIRLSLRLWKEAEVIAWASQAGLKCIETPHTSHETYYVFQNVTGLDKA